MRDRGIRYFGRFVGMMSFCKLWIGLGFGEVGGVFFIGSRRGDGFECRVYVVSFIFIGLIG